MNNLKKVVAGFTLIELLIIIVILSALTITIFPVFAETQEKDKQAVCLSNIKQIAIAVAMYKEDYNGVYPMCYIDKTYEGGTATQWNNILGPYARNQEIFFCPASFRKYSVGAEDGCRAYNYSANRALLQYHYKGEQGEGLYSKDVTKPEKTYLIWDGSYMSVSAKDLLLCGVANGYLPGSGSFNGIPFDDTDFPAGKEDYMTGRHDLGVNMAYADFHVRYLKSKVVWDNIFAEPSPFNPQQ